MPGCSNCIGLGSNWPGLLSGRVLGSLAIGPPLMALGLRIGLVVRLVKLGVEPHVH